MLQGFLARYAQSCHLADRSDLGTVANLRQIVAPRLGRHRKIYRCAQAHLGGGGKQALIIHFQPLG